MEVREVPKPAAAAGQVAIRVSYSGANFIDVYFREGKYQAPLPFILGGEGSGHIESVGEGVEGLAPGDAVSWYGPLGSCAEYAAVDAAMVVKVPDGVPLDVAAALMMQGITAHYLAHSTYPLKAGDTALIHAAAGGVGNLLTQMAKAIGTEVFATVSTEEKAKIAREVGADHVILYTQVQFDVEVRRLTNGTGVGVVYDGVGKTTFEQSLKSLRPLGLLALYGAASGPVPPFDLARLSTMGSLFVTRPMSFDYIKPRAKYLERMSAIFDMYKKGQLKARIDAVFPLDQVSAAYETLEGRKSIGKVLISLP
jgi:NADPH2:quinone reductase